MPTPFLVAADTVLCESAPQVKESTEKVFVRLEAAQSLVPSTVCLVCRRDLHSEEMLEKHYRSSKRHKYNIETQGLARLARPAVLAPTAGSHESRSDRIDAGGPPIEDDNIGAQILRTMGWSKGHGLGKAEDGIVDPIRIVASVDGAGLGAGADE